MKDFLYIPDSRNCLQSLQKQIPTNSKVRKQKHTIANLQKSGKTEELCWIPGHADPRKRNKRQKGQRNIKTAQGHYSMPLSRHFFSKILMTPYMKDITQSGMRKMTNINKSSQIPVLGNKVIDAERMKLLGSELAIHY